MAKAKRMGYRETLWWIVDTDDTEWLDDEEPIPSVTAVLTADIFGYPIEKVTKDLTRLRDKEK